MISAASLIQNFRRKAGVEKVIIFLSRTLHQLKSGVLAPGKRISGLSDGLHSAAGQLMKDNQQVEPAFFRLGRDLQSIYQEASVLSQSTVDTAALLGGNNDTGVLRQVDRIVRESMTQLRGCLEEIRGDVACFAKGAEHMGRLYNFCTVIDQMALTLQVVGLNIGVESARTSEGEDMFAQVALDVSRLSGAVRDLAGNIREGALGAQTHQHAAHREISNGIHQMTALSAEAEKAVQNAAENIKKLMELAISAMESAGTHSREISNQVGKVVVGIQFQDNMSQRIAHINESLCEVSERFGNAGEKRRSAENRDAALCRAHQVVTLQIAQLQQVLREIGLVYEENIRAFDAIGTHVGALAESLSLFDSAGASGRVMTTTVPQAGGDQSSIDNLNKAISRFQGLVEQGERLHLRMRETFSEAADSAARLSGYAADVRRTNFELHIIALNAIVKAAHMGSDGRALEVLAQAVKTLSDQSNTFMMQVDGLLNEITEAVRIQQGDTRRVMTNDPGFSGDSVKSGMAAISGAYQKLQTDSAAITLRTEALKEATAQTRRGLEFMPELVGRFSESVTELLKIQERVSPWAGLAMTGAALASDHLVARYTMDQERIIHEQQMTQPPGGRETQADLSDDGFEFFGDAEPPSTAGDDAAPSEQTDLDGITFFDTNESENLQEGTEPDET